MKQIKNIYDHLPAPLGNLAFSAAGANIQRTRYGRGFHEMLAEFESHEGWPAERVAEWRDARLRKLICHAYRTVPYYHDLMDEGGVDPASIKGIDDLEMLPTLTKDMVKSAPERFVSSEASSMNLMHVHTSGTTGSGFRFLSTVECQQAQFACFWRYYRKHGIDIGTWQAQFSSRQAVPKRVSTPPFWRIDYPGRRYYMSAFHESPANLRYYYEVIQENRFEWISGYPSLMVLLAQWMNERDLRFDFIRAVTCGAENLLDHQADAMERAFGVRPVQTYGQTENVAIFSQQPDRRILVDEDFSAVEFLPTANNAGGGYSRWSGPVYSTMPRLSSDTGRKTSSRSETRRGQGERSPRSMGGRRTISLCRTARASENSITCSRTRRISRRPKSISGRTIRLSCGSWGSRICA